MRLKHLEIKNFRVFKHVAVEFDDYTCFVGPNGCGKSSIFAAINLLFREPRPGLDPDALHREDFHHQDTSQPVEVTATFDQLSDAAREDLKAYVRHGQLVLSAVASWDESSGKAKVEQHGQRLVMPEFASYFQAEKTGEPVARLREIFAKLRDQFPEITAATTKKAMADALTSFETAHPDKCELVRSSDQFYGFSKGTNKLLAHIRWAFIPAVKDAIDEQNETKNSALGVILSQTIRRTLSFKEELESIRSDALERYREMLQSKTSTLNDISTNLSDKLAEWAHPDASIALRWDETEKSVNITDPLAKVLGQEADFIGDLSRFGHGFQRSFLLALLQELAFSRSIEGEPTLLIACEEPELFQHPPQVRHLADLLERLFKRGTQVAVCTHSPLFVRGTTFESVRAVQKHGKSSRVRSIDVADIEQRIGAARKDATPRTVSTALTKLSRTLQPQLNEMFFASLIVLVEGIEDQAYLESYFDIRNLRDDFRRIRGQIIPANNKSQLLEPAAILKQLDIPHIVIFDCDGDCHEKHRDQHQRDNLSLLLLHGVEGEAFPTEPYWTDELVAWPNNLATCLEEDFQTEPWRDAAERVRRDLCLNGKNLEKAPMFAGCRLGVACEKGARSATLDRLWEHIVARAKQAT